MDQYVYQNFKWGSSQLGTGAGVVTWSFASVNFSGQSDQFDQFITSSAFKTVTRAAFQAWEDVADIDFVERPDSLTVNIRTGWADIDGQGSVLGEAFVRFSAGVIRNAEIFMDTAEDWAPNGGAGKINFYTTMLHEIGHTIGLGHVNDSTQLMYAFSNNLTALAAGDIAGAQAIYGASQTSGGGSGTGNSGGTGSGTSGNDTLTATPLDDQLNGGAGLDTVIMAGSSTGYSISQNASGTWRVTGQGTDILTDIERIRFDNGNYALDINGVAGQAYRIYKAAFNRDPDAFGLPFWIGKMDAGETLIQIAAQFIGTNEFLALYGANPANGDFVAKLYLNVLGRPGEAGGVTFWTGELDAGRRTQEQVLAEFSESPENVATVGQTIGDGFLFA